MKRDKIENQPCSRCKHFAEYKRTHFTCGVSCIDFKSFEPCDEDDGWIDDEYGRSIRLEQNKIEVIPPLEPCDDAVSRKSVINTLDNMDNALDENRTVEEYKALLKECYEVLPSVKPQEPKTGHWIRVKDKTEHWVWKCDKCGWEQRFNTNYCPGCGAKMV